MKFLVRNSFGEFDIREGKIVWTYGTFFGIYFNEMWRAVELPCGIEYKKYSTEKDALEDLKEDNEEPAKTVFEKRQALSFYWVKCEQSAFVTYCREPELKNTKKILYDNNNRLSYEEIRSEIDLREFL